MFFSYACDHEGTRYWFRPYFHYGQEEDTIIIDDVQATVFTDPE